MTDLILSSALQLIRNAPKVTQIVKRGGRSLSNTLVRRQAARVFADMIARLMPTPYNVLLPHKGVIPDQFFTFGNPSTQQIKGAVLTMIENSKGHFGSDEASLLKETFAKEALHRAQSLYEVTAMIRLQRVHFNEGVDEPPSDDIRAEPHLKENIAILSVSLERNDDGTVGLAEYEITDGTTRKVVRRGQENFFKISSSSIRDDLPFIRGCPNDAGLVKVGLFALVLGVEYGGACGPLDAMRFLVSRSWTFKNAMEFIENTPSGSGDMVLPLNKKVLKKLVGGNKAVRDSAREKQSYSFSIADNVQSAVPYDQAAEPVPLLTDLDGDESGVVQSFCDACSSFEPDWYEYKEAGIGVQASILYSMAGKDQLAQGELPNNNGKRIVISHGRLGTMIYVPYTDCMIISTLGMPEEVLGERPFCPLDFASPEVLLYLGPSILGLGMSKEDDEKVIRFVASHMNNADGSLGNPLPSVAKGIIQGALSSRDEPIKVSQIIRNITAKNRKMADDPPGTAVAVRGSCAILASIGCKSFTPNNGMFECFRTAAHKEGSAVIEINCDLGIPMDMVKGFVLHSEPTFEAVVGDLYEDGQQIVVVGRKGEASVWSPQVSQNLDKPSTLTVRGNVKAVMRQWRSLHNSTLQAEFGDCTCG